MAVGLMTQSTDTTAARNEHGPEFEQKLVARIQSGDREAFAELVSLYQKRIFVFAYGFFLNREDALEIVQETFMRVFEKMSGFRQGVSLTGWMYRLTHNLCIDYYRKYTKKRALESSFDDVPDRQLAVAENPQSVLESSQRSAVIHAAIEKLSRRQREVFSLKYHQGMKLQQVAETMAISIGTVKALHHRALRRIRRQVEPGAGGNYGIMS